MHICKPDKEIYKRLLEKYNLEAKETIFIDDSLPNIESANELGINAIQFTTLDEVRQRMRKVADKYADYDKVIFVGHGMAFRTLTYIEKMKPAEIIECTYTIGQEDCIYSFC